MRTTRCWLPLVALLAAALATPCHARGRRAGAGEPPGGGRALPAAALHAAARAFDVAVLPPPVAKGVPDGGVAERTLRRLLEQQGLRVAPGEETRAALAEVGDANARALAARIGCRYLLRTTIGAAHSARALAGGSGLMSVGQMLAGGALVKVLPNVRVNVWTALGVVAAYLVVGGVSLDAQVEVTCEVLDGRDGRSVWSGSAAAQKSRRFFALFARSDPLMRDALAQALRSALLSPRAPRRASNDPWEGSLALQGNHDPWERLTPHK